MSFKLKTHVRFVSNRFPVADSDFIDDPQPGKGCAEYLCDQLKQRYPSVESACVEYDAPSWNLYVVIAGRWYNVIVNFFPPMEGVDEGHDAYGWLVRTYISRGCLEVLLGRRLPPEEQLAAAEAIRSIIEGDERIWNVTWLAESEYDHFVHTGTWPK